MIPTPKQQNSRKVRRAGARHLALLVAIAASAAGCEDVLDDLLAVDRPGQLPQDVLSNPELFPSLVAGVQADFECAFKIYTDYFGLWSGKLNNGNARDFQVEQRNAHNINFYDRGCEGGSYTNSGYGALHVSRAAAKLALEVSADFTPATLPNLQELLGKTRLYEAYATLLLSEAFCAYTEDAGPVQTRVEGFRLAESRFTEALAHAGNVASPDAARHIRNSALIGRARARLNLWSLGETDAASVVADASQVEHGFVFYASYEQNAGARRTNNMYTTNIDGKGWIGPKYRPLRFLEGVPDPRVRLFETNVIPTGTSVNGWAARKFTSTADDVPVGTWREAMLMIAEVQGGQQAVSIINELRATVTEAPYVPEGDYDLPTFSSTDPSAIMAEVRTERMRETLLSGVHMGDLMRWISNPLTEFDRLPTGVPERGSGQYTEFTCRPFPDYELTGNPNINEVSPWPTTPL